jgi:hypothetical protein
LVTGTLFAVVLFAQGTYGGINSTKGVVEAFRLSHQEREDLLFVGPPMYSSSYYTAGRAQTFRDFDSLDKVMSARSITEGECLERVHLAVYKREWGRLSLRQQQSMHIEGRFGDYFLVTSDWHREERHEEGDSNILNPIVTGSPISRGYWPS